MAHVAMELFNGCSICYPLVSMATWSLWLHQRVAVLAERAQGHSEWQ